MLRPLLAAACFALLPAAAGAQDLPQPPIAESAADLAYGYCPLFLGGQFSLTAPELTRHGFGPDIQTQTNPRFGEVQVVNAKREDGALAFGGAPQKTCTVVVAGPQREAALARLRSSMSMMGLSFVPVPHTGARIEGVQVESFRAPIDSQFLHIQLIQASGPTPVVSAQLYVTDE